MNLDNFILFSDIKYNRIKSKGVTSVPACVSLGVPSVTTLATGLDPHTRFIVRAGNVTGLSDPRGIQGQAYNDNGTLKYSNIANVGWTAYWRIYVD